MLTKEFRGADVRMDDISEPGKVFLAGRATTFKTRSQNLGPPYARWYEQIMPGAFDEALQDGTVAHLVNHDTSRFLGDTTAGTTRLKADQTALRYKTELAMQTQEARAIVAHFERGEVRSASFAFSVDPSDPDSESWDPITDEDGEPAMLRTIFKVAALYDVSTLVGAEPAYDSGTSATLSDRALPGMPAELRARLERSAADPDPGDLETPVGDDEADVPAECECACDRCLEARCDRCEEELCLDETCSAAGCPMQRADDDPDDDVLDLLDELNEDDRAAGLGEEAELALLEAELEFEEAVD